MGAVLSGLTGGNKASKIAARQAAEAREAQEAQRVANEEQAAKVTAKESALRKIFQGGAGRRLGAGVGSGTLADVLGG